jgi:hypothetical protein
VQAKVRQGGRQLSFGKISAAGARSGTMDEDVRPVTVEEIAPGAFRVVPDPPLESGEYCFYSSAGATGGTVAKVFDFGIDSTESEVQVVSSRDDLRRAREERMEEARRAREARAEERRIGR